MAGFNEAAEQQSAALPGGNSHMGNPAGRTVKSNEERSFSSLQPRVSERHAAAMKKTAHAKHALGLPLSRLGRKSMSSHSLHSPT